MGLLKNQAASPQRPQNATGTIDESQSPTAAQYRQVAEFFDMTFKFE